MVIAVNPLFPSHKFFRSPKSKLYPPKHDITIDPIHDLIIFNNSSVFSSIRLLFPRLSTFNLIIGSVFDIRRLNLQFLYSTLKPSR